MTCPLFPVRTILIVCSMTIASCATTSPESDARFGEASMQLRAQQLIDANAPTRNRGAIPAADGRSVFEAHERYLDSTKAPPPTSVINIGVGAGAAR